MLQKQTQLMMDRMQHSIAETIEQQQNQNNKENQKKAASIFSPRGRMGRIGFISSCSFFTLFFTVILFIATALTFFNLIAGGVMVIMVAVAYLYIMAVFASKRLHDCNHDAVFWLLILVPAVNVLLFLYLILMPGKKEKNNYGEKPIPMPVAINMMNLFMAAVVIFVLTAIYHFVPFAEVLKALIETEQVQLMLLEYNIEQQRFNN